jgi:hypothetical protein
MTMDEMHTAAWKEHQAMHSWNPDKHHLSIIRVTKDWYALVPKPGAARCPLLNDGIPNGNLNHWPVRSREPYKV